MLYRENGQFKTSYAADQAIFPIRQDRCSSSAPSLVAFFGVPLFATEYVYTEVLIPFLILSMAAIGLNLLTGYCGQVSLGTGGFMAVGAYAAYNLVLRVPGINIVARLPLRRADGGAGRRAVRPAVAAHQGLLSRGRDPGRQFFLDWAFIRMKWFTNYAPSGSVAVGRT